MLNKITIHWTAGRNKPSSHELECYHFLIDADGYLYKGKYAPEDNIDCYDGKYAAHCGGGNTGNIGVAFCGCYVPNGIPVKNTQFPLTRKQMENKFVLKETHNIAISEIKCDIQAINEKLDKIYDILIKA